MDGSILLTLVAVIGIDYGWQAQDDGSLEYIIQIEPTAVQAMQDGEVLVSEILPEVYGVRKFRIQVGDGELPRDAGNFLPSDSSPTSQYQPIVAREPLSRDYGSPEEIGLNDWEDEASAAPALVDPQLGRGRVARGSASRSPLPDLNNPGRRHSPLRHPTNAAIARDSLPYGRRLARDVKSGHAPDPEADFAEYQDRRGSRDRQTRWPDADDRRARNSNSRYGQELAISRQSGPRRDGRQEIPRADTSLDGFNRRRSPQLQIPAEPAATLARRGIDDRRRDDLDPDLRREDLLDPDLRREDDLDPESPPEGVRDLRRNVRRGGRRDPRIEEGSDRFASNQERIGGRNRLADDVDVEADRYRSNSSGWPKALLGLFASLAANAYMGWITWSAVHRYRDLVDDVRRVES